MERTEIERQRTRFRQRTELYLELGFDRLEAARFVAEAGGVLEGPAPDVGTGKAAEGELHGVFLFQKFGSRAAPAHHDCGARGDPA